MRSPPGIMFISRRHPAAGLPLRRSRIHIHYTAAKYQREKKKIKKNKPVIIICIILYARNLRSRRRGPINYTNPRYYLISSQLETYIYIYIIYVVYTVTSRYYYPSGHDLFLIFLKLSDTYISTEFCFVSFII